MKMGTQSTISNFAVTSPIRNRGTKRKSSQISRQNKLLETACQYLSKEDSEEEVFAKGWAYELKRMTPDQRRFAEKFVNDILLEGELGTLHRNSVKINESPSTSVSQSPLNSNSSTMSVINVDTEQQQC
jgi:hypothetical protein